jgi:predicted transcriptional regulator
MGGGCVLASGKGQYLAPLTPSLALENDIEFGAVQIAIKALSRSGGSVRLMRPKRLKYLLR